MSEREEDERLGAFELTRHVRRILSYVGSLGWLLLLAVLGSLLYAALELSLPQVVRFGVDHYLVPGQAGNGQEPMEGLRELGLLYAGLLFGMLFLSYTRSLALNHVGQKVVQRLRTHIWAHLHRLPVRFFDHNPVGRLVTRVSNDTNALSDLFTNVLASGLEDLLRVAGVMLILATMEPRLSLAVAAVLLPLAFMTWWFKLTSSAMHRKIRVLLARVNAFLQENVQGISVVKSFVAEKAMQSKFHKLNRDFYQAEMSLIYLNAVFRPAISAASTIAIGLVLWFGSRAVLAHEITMGTLLAYLFYLRLLFSPLEALAEKLNILQGAAVASERLFRILDTPVEPGYPAQPGERETRARGHLVFENVSFAYDPDKPVLRNVSFEVLPGQTAALVGPSGSGKTTIASLMLGFYRLEGHGSGRILLDGQPLEQWDLTQLRQQFALVQQDLFLFGRQLRQNVALFTPRSDEELWKALELAQAAELVRRFPEGLSHELTERGSTLSQGERQLLSFARALVADPPILLLDEATANIDSRTEQAIQRALKALLEGRTALVVAHRLSTVQDADQILVLRKGELVERGRHDELMRADGLYAHLYRTQRLTHTDSGRFRA